MSRTEDMRKLAEELLHFKKSPLYVERVANKMLPVIGEGSLSAQIVFIGEAPGKKEASTGKPFCGASGRILDELLASIDLPRERVYVTNIVKDRPTDNRDPSVEEIELYAPFLDRQIDIIKPKVIVTLGRFSMDYIMNRYGLEDSISTIGKNHGKVFVAKVGKRKVKMIPLYHPAASIYNQKLKEDLKKDFLILKNCITGE
ncbi:uracil-DNA glycosylase [Candidatus Wolfebacteria bacterium]|nr:MAG: uracil-DNA glycosylase [Candidatus Wolfebacteria bacterium]